MARACPASSAIWMAVRLRGMNLPITAAWIGVDQVNAMAGDYLRGLTGTGTLCTSCRAAAVLRQAGATGLDGARPL